MDFILIYPRLIIQKYPFASSEFAVCLKKNICLFLTVGISLSLLFLSKWAVRNLKISYRIIFKSV